VILHSSRLPTPIASRGSSQNLPVREPIRSWLNTQADIEDAQYLYTAWLNAGGELGVVRDPICKWAIEHGHSPAARSIRQAWLKAGGKPDDILWTV